ncbi:MAG: hypothetical protein JST84_28640 [Acidobacteria bacterium]|nr:hypothetical protein [Acidobacteriota bacterium]
MRRKLFLPYSLLQRPPCLVRSPTITVEQRCGWRRPPEFNGAAEQHLPPVIYRDPADVRTIFQLRSSLLVLVVLFVLSALGNAWQYWRRPDRIVVDRFNGRVLLINEDDVRARSFRFRGS